MEHPKKILIELNEKSFLNAVKFTKNEDSKNNKKIKSNIGLIIFLYFLIFICSFLLGLVFYLLHQKKSNSKIANNFDIIQRRIKKIDNNMIETYIKTQKDFCENPNKYINKIYENEIDLYNVKCDELKYQIF